MQDILPEHTEKNVNGNSGWFIHELWKPWKYTLIIRSVYLSILLFLEKSIRKASGAIRLALSRYVEKLQTKSNDMRMTLRTHAEYQKHSLTKAAQSGE